MSEAHEFRPDFCDQDVHGWFELSYSSYLIVQRLVMQQMPAEWQHRMVTLLEEAHAAFPSAHSDFRVSAIDDAGRFASDPLRKYRYPDWNALEAARSPR